MKISTKSRYGLAVLASMAKYEGVEKNVAVLSMSERLDISKLYLEQVFAILRRGGFVKSVKGSNGGYHLAREAKDISAYDVLLAIEPAMFEKTESTILNSDESLEKSINENVYVSLDKAIKEILSGVSLEDIVNKSEDGYMYYL